MTRIDELIFALLDRSLTPEESDELEGLLATDEANQSSLVLLRLEAALRARRRNLKVEAGVIEQLQQSTPPKTPDAQELRRTVLERIRKETVAEETPAKFTRLQKSRVVAFAIAGVVVLGVMAFSVWENRDADTIIAATSLPATNAGAVKASPVPFGTTDPPSVWTHASWPSESAHRVWFFDLGAHALSMATSADGSHWSSTVRLKGLLPSAGALTLLFEPERAEAFRLYYTAKTAAGGEIHVAESTDGVNFHNDTLAMETSVPAEGLAVAVLTAPVSAYRLYYRDTSTDQIVYATSRDGRSFVGVDSISTPAKAAALSLRPARFEKAATGDLLLWTLDSHDHPHLLASTNGYTWTFADGTDAVQATTATSRRPAGEPGHWSFFSPMDDWQKEGWIIFSNSGTVPDGVETALLQGSDGTLAIRDRRSWGNFYLSHEAAWTVPFTVEARVRLDDIKGTDGDAAFPKFTIASIMRDTQIAGPQTWQPAFGKERFGAWSLEEGPWAPNAGDVFQTFTIVCRFDPEARRKLAINPGDAEAKVAVCVFDVYTNRNFTTPALTFHNMGFVGWRSVDAQGRLDIGFPWPDSGQITLDWVRWGNGVILDPQEPTPTTPAQLANVRSHHATSAGWQVADSPRGPWIRVSDLGELAMLAPLGRPKYYRPYQSP